MLRLKELRLAKGLTQDQLADAAGIDQSRVSALECEANPNPTLQTIVALARALGVEPPALFPVPTETGDAA